MKKAVKHEVFKRPSWDEYFMGMANYVGTRATCDRGRSGCVIAQNKRVVSTGYVGSPPGLPHCDEVGHDMQKAINEDGTESMHCVRTIHAEQNAMVQAARFGVSLDGATLYCRMVLCHVCAKLAITAGIKRVVAENDYHASSRSKTMLKKAGVELEILNNKVEEYSSQ
ncbi:MAG: cytidine/deoxycytidylate deaminase family protein [bacterium]|nr:cytidine/deoxycytidylate deaminase family protein [bacterium]